jgi:hypothetical protein
MAKKMGFGYGGTEKASMKLAKYGMGSMPKFKSVIPKKR